MIPSGCKRLAEVDFPIAEVSRHAVREKSIRHGHPSTLHLWWARRPLASSRAVLLALLLPDPCDPLCPPAFKTHARAILPAIPRCNPGPTDDDLRRSLLRFIADMANWNLAADRAYLETARALVQAAYPDEPPLVVDPFAGGGSIPLEALRLGCETVASDLNPVAGLILKVLLETIPRWGRAPLTVPGDDGQPVTVDGLAAALRHVGAQIKRQAERELADLYPPDPDGALPIAYLWARAVRCEAPGCGAEIPLARSFWLAKKASRRRALRPIIRGKEVIFEIIEPRRDDEVPPGTISRARATCLVCGAALPPERVRAQLAAQRGGGDVVFDPQGRRIGGARLLAVVTLRPGQTGRSYRLPTDADYAAVWRAQQRRDALLAEWEAQGRPRPRPVPDEPTPEGGGAGAGRAFSVRKYGMTAWGDLFTARQQVALATLARLVRGATAALPSAAGEAVREGLAFAVSKQSDFNSSLSRWANHMEKSVATFARQALPMLWDWGEVVPLSDSSGALDVAIDWIANSIATMQSQGKHTGQMLLADAADHPLPDATATVWFTDPPYYDAVPYADLSDFFFVWLKRALPGHPLLRDPFDLANPLTPKAREAVQNERALTTDGRPKDKAFYEEAMARAFAEGRRVLRADGVGAVVFAHKTTEGWEALLSALIRSGWTITGSWPIATEMAARLRARDSAALATSVHLICRPRPADAPVGDWAGVLRDLPQRVGAWIARLQGEGVRGADLVFACIGPALELFSRFRRVETADGREITLAEFLEKVWEVVGRAALAQVLGAAEAQARDGGVGALEEDARLTALFLWTLQSAPNGNERDGAPAQDDDSADDAAAMDDEGDDADDARPAQQKKDSGYALVFDVVRRFAQPLGIDLARWEGRIIATEKGVVRLLPVRDRARQLCGRDGATAIAQQIAQTPAQNMQLSLFTDPAPAPPAPRAQPAATRSRRGVEPIEAPAERAATTLDRVHLAMLFQASGQAEALRALLRAEQERGTGFLRLANALSALYPPGSEEKRLLDAMLLAVPR